MSILVAGRRLKDWSVLAGAMTQGHTCLQTTQYQRKGHSLACMSQLPPLQKACLSFHPNDSGYVGQGARHANYGMLLVAIIISSVALPPATLQCPYAAGCHHMHSRSAWQPAAQCGNPPVEPCNCDPVPQDWCCLSARWPVWPMGCAHCCDKGFACRAPQSSMRPSWCMLAAKAVMAVVAVVVAWA
jgi:hypothetical protein